MRFTIVLLLAIFISGCTEDVQSRRALEALGFSDIKLDGYAWLACSDDDTYKTKFTAKNPQGRPVSGAVCCGMLKNCTVRFE